MNNMRHSLLLFLFCAGSALGACTGRDSADWESLRKEANQLYGEQRYEEAVEVYERALAVATDDNRLTLRQDIIDCYQGLGRQDEVRRLLDVQMQEAHAAGNSKMEAEALMTLGLQVYDAGDKAKGYDYMQQAVGLMKKQRSAVTDTADVDDALFLLAYYHNCLMTRKAEDNELREALEHTKAVELCIMGTSQPERAENMLVRALAWRAYLYCETDNTVQADSTYAVWQQHLPVSITVERDICHYLMKRGRYEEVLNIQQRYVDWVREKKGEYTNAMRTSKLSMAEAQAAIGRDAEAYCLLKEAYEISDTLHTRQAIENAQELAAEHHDREQQEQIAAQRLWIAALAAMLGIIAAVALLYRISVVRKRKDKTMAAIVRDMTPTQPLTSSQSISSDRNRFLAFDTAVNQGRLYAKADVTRDVLVGVMAVDSNTFSRIIREQSGCQNLNEYLNNKRIDLACQLLKEHPNWSMEAIAADCGFQSVRTFYRVFKGLKQMTPSDYVKK